MRAKKGPVAFSLDHAHRVVGNREPPWRFDRDMSVADDYRRHAEACLQAARAAQVEQVKLTLVAMAQRWTEAAEREERFSAETAEWKQLGPSRQKPE